ncbi:MAG TPA: hypothetical protein VM054_05045 [bacterium]|nr:hypothetical protein [bacterium]
MPDNNPLEKELAWFEENRKRLFAEHPNKWVCVYGDKLIGIFDSFAEAFKMGVEKAGTDQILVKQILLKDLEFRAPAYTLGILVDSTILKSN